MVTDILDKNEQKEITVSEHNRAHRAAQENVKQIMQDYFFPKMTHMANEVVANCNTCQKEKYDRHPQKQILGETPIPSYTGELLHIDMFLQIKNTFANIFQLINFYRRTKTIYCDNKPSIKSETIKSLLSNQFNIEIVNAPPHHSTSNGQVERFHSTLAEIARCLKIERRIKDTVELNFSRL